MLDRFWDFEKRKKKRINWISEEILELIQKKKAAFLKCSNSKKKDDRINYAEKRKQLKQIVRTAQNDSFDIASIDINNELGCRNGAESWSIT